MKIITCIMVVVFCVASLAAAYDENDFNSTGRVHQPAPQGHVPGKDNGAGVGLHQAGVQCGNCHTPGGAAQTKLWTIAGTLYADKAGKTPLPGGEIIVEDRAGNIISVTANEVGNFWTAAPIASNPYAVYSHGGVTEPMYVLDEECNLVQPADPADPRTWQYKCWVRYGNVVRPMVTVAPVGSATGKYMSCNMHHSPTGSRGALRVSHLPMQPSYPASGLLYTKHIQPIFSSKCAPCHIQGSTKTRLVTMTDIEPPSTSIDYSCTLDLINYRGSAVSGNVKRGVRAVANTADPGQSLMLQKTLPGALHGGGAFWDQADPDYLALRQWIAEGAQNNIYTTLRAVNLLIGD